MVQLSFNCFNHSTLLGCAPARVNLKVTSTDRLGAFGREEGIAGLAVVLLEEGEKAA